jgi:endoglucanase
VRRYTWALLAATLTVLTAPSVQAAPTPTGALHVSGNKVLDSTGKPVVLRGIHRDGTQGGPSTSTTPVTANELGYLGRAYPGSWHSSVVRVPVGSAQWTGACPALASSVPTYRATIDREITALTKQGIVALLDLHTSTADCTSIDRHAMPDAKVTKAFWADAAAHYAANKRVAFELYNEPHFVSESVWLNGSLSATVQDCDTTVPLTNVAGRLAVLQCQLKAPRYQAIGMQALYDLVSTTAPGHLIVVDAPGYAATAPTMRVAATHGNLVYGFHPYTCSVPGAVCDSAAGAQANTTLLNSWLALGATAPVLVTEFGWPTYSQGYDRGYIDGSRYYAQTIAFLDKQQWGWIAFAFDGNSGGGFSLITSAQTYAPNSTGRVVYNALRTHNH